ncbi:MAG: S1 RNA-binding domain-containing protein, partial [Chloroflexi bacterium]|nr:S1 RNA-binding domain-containing protein [Chloroflexota bacterium]
MATADTPDSQVEAPKVETPVEQNNDASLESAAPEAAAPEAPKTEAPVAEVTPAVAEEAAVVNSPEETAPAVEAAIEEAPADADAETAVAVADKPESELTMEDLLDEYLPSKVLRRGEIIDGRVMSRKAEGMLVDIGYKSEGFVPTKEMRSLADASDELSVGDEIIAYVVNPEGNEGSSILSIDRARGEQGWRVLEKAMDN